MKPKNRFLLAATIFVAAAPAAHAADVIKANNTDALNLGTSWAGGTAPGTGDVAVWNNTVIGANQAALGADLSWGGIKVLSPGGTVTIGSDANILTLGTSGIDLSNATQSLYLNGASTSVGSNNQVWNVANTSYLRLGNANLDGVLTGSATITISGSGLVDLNPTATGASGFSGKWIVNSGATLRTTRNSQSGDWDALGSNTSSDAVTLNGGTLAVGGFTGSGAQGNWTWANPITLAASSSSIIENQIPVTTTKARTLTLTGVISGSGSVEFRNPTASADSTFRFIVGSANTYTGNTIVNAPSGGILQANLGTAAGAKTPFGTGTVTVNSGATLRMVASSTGNAMSLANNLVLKGATLTSEDAVQTFSGTMTLEGANTIASYWGGKDTVLSGVIQDGTAAGSLTLKPGQSANDNAITVSGNNSYTGGTTLGDNTGNKGIVIAGHHNAFGTGALNFRGAQLRAGTAGLTIANNMTVGNGGFRVGGTNSFTLGGTLAMDAASRTIANYSTNGSTVTIGGITTVAGTTVAFDNAAGGATGAPIVVSGAITGPGTVALSGAQNTTLNGASTYAGATTLAGGRLTLNGSLTSAITTSGGVLTGTGSTTALLTMNAGSTLSLAGGGTTTSLTTNGVAFGGATTLNFLTPMVPYTEYDVVTYGGGGVTGLGNLTANTRGTIADNTGAQKITFTAGGAEARIWNTTSGTWDLYTTANFAEGDQKFANGDSVVFGNIATDATVTLSGALAPNGVAVQNSANTYTFTGSAITGSTSLTKINAGTLTISSQQTYTGGTTVNGGVLSLGYGGSGGAIRGTVTVNAGGTLSLATGDALGYNNDATAVNAIYLNGGTLTSAAGANQTTTAKFHMTGGTINGSVNLDLFSNNAAITTYASPDPSTISVATMNLRQNDTVFDVADGTAADDLLISSAIGNGSTGNHNMIKSGAGAMKLTGVNSFTGNVTVNGGTLDLTTGKLYNAGYNNANVVTVNTGGTLRVGSFSYDAGSGFGKLADYSARRVINGGTIEVSGASHSSGNDFSVGASGGTFRYSASSNTLTLAGNANDNIQLNGALTFDTIGDITVNEVMQGTGGLTKTGAGTLTLGADNTYAGNTNVTQGTLVINGSVSTGNLTVQSGATLMGSGTVGGATSIAAGAYLSPGNSPEIMTFENSLGLNGTTILEIGGLIRGDEYDGIDVAGLLTYGGSLNIVSWNSFSLATPVSYQLFGISGGSAGAFDSVSVGGLSLVNDGGGIWSAVDPGDSEIVYTFTQSTGQLVVIPEPGAALLGGLGLVLLLRRRR